MFMDPQNPLKLTSHKTVDCMKLIMLFTTPAFHICMLRIRRRTFIVTLKCIFQNTYFENTLSPETLQPILSILQRRDAYNRIKVILRNGERENYIIHFRKLLHSSCLNWTGSANEKNLVLKRWFRG